MRRPVTPDGDDEFDLFYVRTGKKSVNPLVIIPGGPGAASIALYRGLRRHAAARGLDVIMLDHRGVGMSRHDDQRRRPATRGAHHRPGRQRHRGGSRRRPGREGGRLRHVVRHVSGRGIWCAAPGSGACHGPRFPVAVRRRHRRRARRNPPCALGRRRPGRGRVGAEGAKARRRRDDDARGGTARRRPSTAWPGLRVLTRQLDLLLAGRRGLWTVLDQASRFLLERKAPYRHEPDLVGRIGFRELNYGAVPDGKPLDPAVAFRESAAQPLDFDEEPYDLIAEMPKFSWPTVVVSGGRDLITPRAVAEEIVSLIPDSVLVDLATAGHSAIDVRERAALDIVEALYDGDISPLRARGKELDAVPASLGIRLLVGALGRRRRRRIRVARCDSACGAAGYFVTGSCSGRGATYGRMGRMTGIPQARGGRTCRCVTSSSRRASSARLQWSRRSSWHALCFSRSGARAKGSKPSSSSASVTITRRATPNSRPRLSQQCWQTLKWLVETAGVEPSASEGATLGLGPELAMATLRGLLRDAERLEDANPRRRCDGVSESIRAGAGATGRPAVRTRGRSTACETTCGWREKAACAGDSEGTARSGAARQGAGGQARRETGRRRKSCPGI